MSWLIYPIGYVAIGLATFLGVLVHRVHYPPANHPLLIAPLPYAFEAGMIWPIAIPFLIFKLPRIPL